MFEVALSRLKVTVYFPKFKPKNHLKVTLKTP